MRSESEVAVDKNAESKKFVAFELGKEEFGADVTQIKEISRVKETTEIPTAPDFVEGIINLRGTIAPIIDLRKRLNLEPKELDSDSRIVIAERGDQFIGMIVDTVTDVLEIPEENIDAAPKLITTEISEEYLKGVGKVGEDRLIILLDLTEVLSRDKFERIEELDEEGEDEESESKHRRFRE